jgi:hypothetical protein
VVPANDNSLRTDRPRFLTFYEVLFIRDAGRIKGIQLHMRWTNSTVSAAVRAVDEVMGVLSETRPPGGVPSGFAEDHPFKSTSARPHSKTGLQVAAGEARLSIAEQEHHKQDNDDQADTAAVIWSGPRSPVPSAVSTDAASEQQDDEYDQNQGHDGSLLRLR